MFKNFTTENWLSLWSIGVPVMISAAGFITSLVLNFFAERNKRRPIILISIIKHHKNGQYNTELMIKNYGESLGSIQSVDINPLYEVYQDDDILEPNGFMKFQDFPLAPGQSITTMISTGSAGKLINLDKRTFQIKYKPDFFKIFPYNEKYTIDEKHFPTIFSDGNFTTENRIEKLASDVENGLSKVAESINKLN